MRVFKTDMTIYGGTMNNPGGPTLLLVEEDIPEIEMICDENGVPTKGGRIGYALAYCLMVALIGYMFWVL